MRYYGKIHSILPIFRVKSIKIYTGQKKFTRDKYQVWVNCARDLSDQPISVYACVCDPYFSFGRTHRRQTDILTKVFHEVLAEQNNFIGDGGSTALSKTPDNNIADIADMAHMAHMTDMADMADMAVMADIAGMATETHSNFLNQ